MHPPRHIDVACVIHGNVYDFQYVTKLCSMISRNLDHPVRLNVLTEPSRSIPRNIIKHDLIEWPGVQGRRAAWWYKMQLFRPDLDLGQILYFDLDTVIIDDLNWILNLDLEFFWTIRDFKYLWRPHYNVINSSMMYFDRLHYQYVWDDFSSRDLSHIRTKYRGDQDYLTEVIESRHIRFIDAYRAQSWRWQILDGGLDVRTRQPRHPGKGPMITPGTSVVICHGNPKPHEINDSLIDLYWR